MQHQHAWARLPDEPGEPAATAVACCGFVDAALEAEFRVHYFQLFFWKELGMTPAQVSLVLIGNNVGGAGWTLAAQKLSLLIGRVQVVLLCKVLGIGMLVGLVFCPIQVSSR